MPQRRESNAFMLSNGNRVTITTGSRKSSTYKTVTVKRPDGTSTSRTYRRGALASHYLGGYDSSVPSWAGSPETRAAKKSGRKVQLFFFAIIVLIVLIVMFVHALTKPHCSYADGYNWGYANTNAGDA